MLLATNGSNCFLLKKTTLKNAAENLVVHRHAGGCVVGHCRLNEERKKEKEKNRKLGFDVFMKESINFLHVNFVDALSCVWCH